MSFTLQNSRKALIGVCVTVMFFATFASSASARTYYYYGTPIQEQAYSVQSPMYPVQNQSYIAQLQAQVNVLIAQLRALRNTSNYSYVYPQPQTYTYGNYYTGYSNGSHDTNDDDTPDVTTDEVRNIEDDRAELRGEVDMNDFEDGIAFFVYGEDEDAVSDVEDEDMYNDVDEDGSDLQKVLLSTSVDDSRSFRSTIFNLDDDTDHFFRMCVQYEDEDNDDVLACGDVEEFTTDN